MERVGFPGLAAVPVLEMGGWDTEWGAAWGWGSSPLYGWRLAEQGRWLQASKRQREGRVGGHQDGQLPGPQPCLPSLPSRGLG